MEVTMDKPQLKTEQRTIQDGKQQQEALGNPQHFYPRPEDVLSDDSLSAEDKRAVLDNWQVALQGKAGTLGTPLGPGEDDPSAEQESMCKAVAEARARLE
jgi:hypothetical protein